MRVLLIMLAALSAAACGTEGDRNITQRRPPPIIISASGQKVCAIHEVPFKVAPGYGTEDYAPGSNVITCVHAIGEPADLERRNPNALPYTQSLRRDKLHTVPITVEYCPRCQNAVYW